MTVPTPCSRLEVTPSPPRRTVAITSAPWVTSGSSPASLMMPARAQSCARPRAPARKIGVSPFGSVIVDGIGKPAGQQCRIGRLGRRRGARAGRPAAPQFALGLSWTVMATCIRGSRQQYHDRVQDSTRSNPEWLGEAGPPPGFARLDAEAFPPFEPGTVWLVGAGPGAPGLMSLLGYHAMQTATSSSMTRWSTPTSCAGRGPAPSSNMPASAAASRRRSSATSRCA